jgi:hypothetical protein
MGATTRRSPHPGQQAQRSDAPRVLLLVLGGIATFLALCLLAGGAAALWGLSQRDKSGYFVTESHRLSTPSYAFASSGLDIGPDAPSWIGDFAGVKIEARSSQSVFLGIGPTSDVTRYLAQVAHSQITDFDTEPFTVTSHDVIGSRTPTPPASQRFWRVQASGPGLQTITWPVETGNWSAVAMNADGSPNLSIATRVGARIPALNWVAIGFLASGGVLLLVGGGLIYVGVRRRTQPDRTR